MMKLKLKYGHWACVAGAAQGLGLAFCEELAKRGFNLIMVDQGQETLGMSVDSIQEKYKVEIDTLNLDLGNQDSVDKIMAKIKQHKCRMLIYNAAYGPVKPFLSNSSHEIEAYINVNTRTLLQLLYQFINMFQNQSVGILLLSSLAGFRGTQFVVPYAATKAFTWNLAEGLYYEFKDTSVDISVCCPGPTDTPNFQATNPRPTLLSPKPRNPSLVADEALRKIGKRLFIFPGLSNKISHLLLNRILPRRLSSGLHNYAMKKMYG